MTVLLYGIDCSNLFKQVMTPSKFPPSPKTVILREAAQNHCFGISRTCVTYLPIAMSCSSRFLLWSLTILHGLLFRADKLPLTYGSPRNKWPILTVLSLAALLSFSKLKALPPFRESIHLMFRLPPFSPPSTFPSMTIYFVEFCLLNMCPKYNRT